MALKYDKTFENNLIFGLFLSLGLICLISYFTFSTEFFLNFANKISEDGTCNICSISIFVFIKDLILIIGIILTSVALLNKKYNFLDKILKSNIFNNKLFIFLFVIACILIFHHLGFHSIWLDEAWVANSILEPNIKSMIFYEAHPQFTPALFLISIKALITILGVSDFTIRLLPAIFGSLSILLIYLLTKKLTKNKVISLLTTSLFGFNYVFLRYSQELKQYTGDIFFALLIFYLTELLIEKRYNLKYFGLLTFTSIIAIFFSLPSIFIIATISLRLFIDIYKKSRLKELIKLGSYISLTLAAFIIHFLLILKPLTNHSGAQNYWIEYFATSLNPIYLISFLLKQSYSFFKYLFNILPFLFLVLFIIGLVIIIKKKNYPLIIYSTIPFFLTFLASIIKKFPYGGTRVTLFLIPFILLLIALTLYKLVSLIKRFKKLKILIFLILILSLPILSSLQHFIMPRRFEELKPVIKSFEENKLEADRAYFYWVSARVYTYYGGIADEFITFGTRWDNSLKLLNEINEKIDSSKGKRFWFISSHIGEQNKNSILEILNEKCKFIQNYKDIGASAYLYQC